MPHVCRGIGDVGEVDVNRGDREVNGIEAGKVEEVGNEKIQPVCPRTARSPLCCNPRRRNDPIGDCFGISTNCGQGRAQFMGNREQELRWRPSLIVRSRRNSLRACSPGNLRRACYRELHVSVAGADALSLRALLLAAVWSGAEPATNRRRPQSPHQLPEQTQIRECRERQSPGCLQPAGSRRQNHHRTEPSPRPRRRRPELNLAIQ